MGINMQAFCALSGLLHPMHRSLTRRSQKNISDKLICGENFVSMISDQFHDQRLMTVALIQN